MSSVHGPPPGWYSDPGGAHGQRYWDGQAWTSHQSGTYQAPVVYVQRPANGLAVAGLVCGIVGLVLGLIPILFFAAWALGITGFVLALAARNRAVREPAIGRKAMATWGIVLSAGAFAMGCLGYAIVNDAFSDVEKVADCIEDAETAADLEKC